MNQELTTTQSTQPAPFGQGQQPGRGLALHANVGAVSIESERAIAEARGQIQVAQMFPRDVAAARSEFMDECDNLEFAMAAIYSVPQAGGKVSGPSIRFAEECARCYGHMEYGHRELSRTDGKSEVEVYAWDKQKNNNSKRQITVLHVLDTREGPKKLRDQRDIDNKIANIASKQIRGRILALVPKSFVEAGLARCKATVAAGGGVSLKQRVNRMADAFAKLGVTAEILKTHLGHPLDTVDADELVDLTAIHNAIRGGDKIADHFQREEAKEEAQASGLAETAKKGAAAAAAHGTAKPKTTKPAAEAPGGDDAGTVAETKQQEAAAPAPTAGNAKTDGKAAQKTSNPVEEKTQVASVKPTAEHAAAASDDEGDFF